MRGRWIQLAVLVAVLSFVAGCIPATPVQPSLPPPTTEARPAATQPPASQAPPTPVPPTPALSTATPAPQVVATASPTPLPALTDVVKAFEAAVNRDDASGFPALFPDQFVSSWAWALTAVNQQQLAGLTAEFAAMHDNLHLKECSQSGANQVKCIATYSHDCLRDAGVPALEVSLSFTILEDKIKVLSYQISAYAQPDDDKDIVFSTGAGVWLRKEHPDLQTKLYDPKGDYIMSGEAGAIWAQVCQEYAATLKQ